MTPLSPLLVLLAQAGVPAGAAPALDAPDGAPALTLAERVRSESAPFARDGFSWGLLLRAFYALAPEEADADGAAAAVSGFVLEDADLHASYADADVAARLSVDLDGMERDDDDESVLALEDAYARWQHLDWLALTAGQFKPRVLRSGSVPASELLFRERTFLGAAFDTWDRGFELGGHWDEFGYWLAVTDGANGSAADHFVSARAAWALVDDALFDREGARGSANHLRVVLGAALFRDDGLSSDEGDGFGADLAFTFGPWAFHGEWASFDAQFAREIDVFGGHLLTLADGHPYAATLSRLLGTETELAVRYQDADEADATRAFGVALSWSPGSGPARFVADLELVEGDTRDFTLLSLGVVVGASGLGLPGGAGPR